MPNQAHPSPRSIARAGLCAAAAWIVGAQGLGTARAAPPVLSIPTEEELQPTQGSFIDNLDRTTLLLGNMGGLRSDLAQYGMSLAIQETSEVLGNPTGGTHQGADYDGLTQFLLQLDTQRAFDWYGGTFNASALQIHGRDLSTDNLQTLQTASGIEADRSTRLWELWYQQKFLEEDRLDIKIGQQSLDQEFMVSQNASYFVNTMFGWPMVPSADLPGGGPAYPLSALGVRARARPIDELSFLLGVFSGSPSPSNVGDPQVADRGGISFPVNKGALVIGEMQFTYPALGSMISPNTPQPLSRTYKLGFWYDTENFADQQFDNTGLSLANPASNGEALNHHGDYGLYAVADQLVWVDPHEGDRTVNLFGRVTAAPQADRNLVTLAVNGGVLVHEPFLNRDFDVFGAGFGFAKVSGDAAALDKATALYTGAYTPIRGSETYVELTYQYQLFPWLTLQPDAQYIFTPGGGLADPDDPGHRIGNELVIGLRTNILL